MKTYRILIPFILLSFTLTGCYTQLQLPERSYVSWDQRNSTSPMFDYAQVAPDDTSYLYGFEDGAAYAERYFVNYDPAWGFTPMATLWSPFDPWMNVGWGMGFGWNSWGWNGWNSWGMNPFWGWNNWMAWDPWFAPTFGFGGWFAPGWGNNWVVYNAHTSRPNHLRTYGPRNSSVTGGQARHDRVFSGSSTRAPRSGYSIPGRSTRSGSSSVGRTTRTRNTGSSVQPKRSSRTRSSGSVSRGSSSSKSSSSNVRSSRSSNSRPSRSAVKSSSSKRSRSSSSSSSTKSRKARTIAHLTVMPSVNSQAQFSNNSYAVTSQLSPVVTSKPQKPSSLVRALGFLGGMVEGIATQLPSEARNTTSLEKDKYRNSSSSLTYSTPIRSSRN